MSVSVAIATTVTIALVMLVTVTVSIAISVAVSIAVPVTFSVSVAMFVALPVFIAWQRSRRCAAVVLNSDFQVGFASVVAQAKLSAFRLTSVLNVLAILPSFLFWFCFFAFLVTANGIKIRLFVQKSSVIAVFHTKYYVCAVNSVKILEKKCKILYNICTDVRRT